ncbi:MAG: murein biosynthesis integral membrane protein MurJ [Candidatus Adiutrix intracellularis]|jgi:putative peptidoglycan lipid II flippase|nr:murein biosynthesis integral membrane protein MurJ [Candidatus Adiutrix intracellularis]
MEENHQIARTAGIVSGATLLSRLAGLARDQVTANFFGDSSIAAAFVVAFRIPNLLRRLLAEGALTVAFVPVFVQTLAEGGPGAAKKLFRCMFTLLSLTLLVICAVGILLAPEIVSLMAPGFSPTTARYELTVLLTRLLFPYIFFIGLGALFMGALNSGGYFAVPALGPFAANLTMIAAIFFFNNHLEQPILSMVIGALAGGALQLAVQKPSLRCMGLSLRPKMNFSDPAIKKIIVLMGPAALGAAVYQISVFINTILASFLPEGSIPWLYYSDRLMQFPLGIFTMAISSAALPALSRLAASGDQAGFLASARFALDLSFFITIPAMTGLIILAEPLVTFLFQRGAFTTHSTAGTAAALKAFALGLPCLSGAAIITRIFYSRHDTRTPTLVGIGSLAAGAGTALILMSPLKHVGLALASSFSSLVNFIWLFIVLLKRERGFPLAPLLKELTSYVTLAAVMGVVIWPLGLWAAASGPTWALGLKTLITVAGGVLIYTLLALITRRPQAIPLIKLFHRRFPLKY